MKTSPLTLVFFALFLGGCFAIPSPYADRLNPVASHYKTAHVGTSRVQLESEFGAPTRTENGGASVWETRFDELNYVVLKVWFDPQEKAQKIETTQAHGKAGPGYQASAVLTKSK